MTSWPSSVCSSAEYPWLATADGSRSVGNVRLLAKTPRLAVRGYRRVDDELVQCAVALMQRTGRSFRQVAATLGVSEATLRRWCKGRRQSNAPAASAMNDTE